MKKKNILYSFKYAFTGIISSIKKERNMKIHISIMTIVMLLGIILRIQKIEWIICIILFGLVISLEMINTSIEIVVDMVMPNKNENAKNAKDISAGAVLIVAITSLIIGLIIFIPKIYNFLLSII